MFLKFLALHLVSGILCTIVNAIYLNNICMKESSCIAAEEYFIVNIYQECKYTISAEKSLKSDIWE